VAVFFLGGGGGGGLDTPITRKFSRTNSKIWEKNEKKEFYELNNKKSIVFSFPFIFENEFHTNLKSSFSEKNELLVFQHATQDLPATFFHCATDISYCFPSDM
jgi:hypothetical protein